MTTRTEACTSDESDDDESDGVGVGGAYCGEGGAYRVGEDGCVWSMLERMPEKKVGSGVGSQSLPISFTYRFSQTICKEKERKKERKKERR